MSRDARPTFNLIADTSRPPMRGAGQLQYRFTQAITTVRQMVDQSQPARRLLAMTHGIQSSFHRTSRLAVFMLGCGSLWSCSSDRGTKAENTNTSSSDAAEETSKTTQDDEVSSSSGGSTGSTSDADTSSDSSGGEDSTVSDNDGDDSSSDDDSSSGQDSGSGGSDTDGSGGAQSTGAAPSLGCKMTTTLQSGKTTIDVDGTEREFIISIPENYDESHPYRLIFGFHGRQYDAEWVANGEEPLTGPYFGLADEAEGDAIFVAPQALSSSWTDESGRDIAFVESMVAEFTAQLCIDESRIFAVGFSFGAIMTNRIGCELYDTFRAVAPMSSSLPDPCSNALPAMPYWGSHGLQDTTILPAQGEAVRDSYRARNHCSDSTSAPNENGCISYDGCDAEAPVVWCTFTGAHEPAPFAGPAIWAFLSQF